MWGESVVVTKGGNKKGVFKGFVNKSVFAVDAARPVARKGMFKGLGLSRPSKRGSSGFFDKGVDTPKDFFVGFLPVQIILPCVLGKDKLQSESFLSDPFPSSSWAMDSIRRRVFLGDLRRYAVSSRAS